MKEPVGERIFNVFNILLMLLLSVLTVYPMIYVIFASLSDSADLMAHSGLLIHPLGMIQFDSYRAVLQNPNIISGYLNTLVVMLGGVSLNILMTSIGAYFLSRKNVMFRNVVMVFIVFTMVFSGGLIPFYLTVKGLGLYNSLAALILPVAINTFNLIIMKTAFQAIPDSIEESAKIDGAGHFTILFKIIVPLSMPVIAVMILYYGVQHWNAWFNASIFLQRRELFPLQLILREILIQNDILSMTAGAGAGETVLIGESVKYAVVTVVTLPILVLYPLLQKYFVKGALIGSLKE